MTENKTETLEDCIEQIARLKNAFHIAALRDQEKDKRISKLAAQNRAQADRIEEIYKMMCGITPEEYEKQTR